MTGVSGSDSWDSGLARRMVSERRTVTTVTMKEMEELGDMAGYRVTTTSIRVFSTVLQYY